MSSKISYCRKSGREFKITESDQKFCRKIGVPLPTLCPEERLRRRLGWRNPITVYSRTSSATGEKIFSMFNQDAPFPVVEKDLWWSDTWDARDYGCTFDFSRPFFDQFFELSRQVPRFPLSIIRIEQSEYVNNATALKKCYMTFGSNNDEDCMYCNRTNFSRDCIDCTEISNCELCYNCTMCEGCYNLQESMFCESCSDSFFLRNCRSCSNCFGCSNLYRQEYCVFNEPYGKDRYESFLAEQNLRSWAVRENLRVQAEEFHVQHPQPALHATNVQDASGEFLYNSRSITESFSVRDGENVRFGFQLVGAKDCLDYSTWGSRAELVYECSSIGNDAYNIRFCYDCFENISDLEYCNFCVSCKDCFGCVGLRNQQYCIFNRCCGRTEYEKLSARIKDHMLESGEYGEFFPLKYSPVPYNHSSAFWYFPCTQEEAAAEGLRWHSEEVIEVPSAVKDLPDELPGGDQPIIAKSTLSGRSFRITSEEMRRYRRLGIPLPRTAYDERITGRMFKLGAPFFYDRSCAKTGSKIRTAVSPESPWIVWDREIYEKEFLS
jgi:hypothetical protein